MKLLAGEQRPASTVQVENASETKPCYILSVVHKDSDAHKQTVYVIVSTLCSADRLPGIHTIPFIQSSASLDGNLQTYLEEQHSR